MRDLQRICCLAIFCALFVLVRDCHLRLAGEELSVFDCDDSEDKCQLSLLQRKAQKEELEMEAQMDVADSDSESESKNGLFDDSAQVPMVAYPKNYCQHCGEMAFCHRASNPGCGGHAMGGVVSFNNHVHANGCRSPPSLTVPRSYTRHLSSEIDGGGLRPDFFGGRSSTCWTPPAQYPTIASHVFFGACICPSAPAP